MQFDNYCDIGDLKGHVLKDIKHLKEGTDEIHFHLRNGGVFSIFHSQNCCEHVQLIDFEDDITNYDGATILSSEEVTNNGAGEIMEMLGSESAKEHEEQAESFTWTFYIINTDRGSLWLRWFGESNGYYSEGVEAGWKVRPPEPIQFH